MVQRYSRAADFIYERPATRLNLVQVRRTKRGIRRSGEAVSSPHHTSFIGYVSMTKFRQFMPCPLEAAGVFVGPLAS
jgi:hypothetical protein